MLKKLNLKKYIFVFTFLVCMSGFLGAQPFAIELRLLVNSIKQVETTKDSKADKLVRIASEIDKIAALIKAKTVDLRQYLVNMDRFRLSDELFNDLLSLFTRISGTEILSEIDNYEDLIKALTGSLKTSIYNFARQQDIDEYNKFEKKFLKIAEPKVTVMKTRDVASSSSSSSSVGAGSKKLDLKINIKLAEQLAELERLRAIASAQNVQAIQEQYQRELAAINLNDTR